MLRDPAGNWVGYAEYAALQAENERLKLKKFTLEDANAAISQLQYVIVDLIAENERLRKAGDAVIEKLAEAYAGKVSEFDHAHVFKAWIEAKETRP